MAAATLPATRRLLTLPNWLAWLGGLAAATALILLVLQVPYSPLNGRFLGCMIICPLLGGWAFGLTAQRARLPMGLLIGLLAFVLSSLVYFPWFASTLVLIRVVGIGAAGGSHGLIEGLIGHGLYAVAFGVAPLLRDAPGSILFALPGVLMGSAALGGTALGRPGRLNARWRGLTAGLSAALLASVTVVPLLVGPWSVQVFGSRRGGDVAAVISRSLVAVPAGVPWQWQPLRPPEQSIPRTYRLPPDPVAGIKLTAAWDRPVGQPAPGHCRVEVESLATPLRGPVGGDIGQVEFIFTPAAPAPALSREALIRALDVRQESNYDLAKQVAPPEAMALATRREYEDLSAGSLKIVQYFD